MKWDATRGLRFLYHLYCWRGWRRFTAQVLHMISFFWFYQGVLAYIAEPRSFLSFLFPSFFFLPEGTLRALDRGCCCMLIYDLAGWDGTRLVWTGGDGNWIIFFGF